MKGSALIKKLYQRIRDHFLTGGVTKTTEKGSDANTIRVHFHIQQDLPTPSINAAKKIRSIGQEESHASEISNLPLERTELLSPKNCRNLRELGLITAADLLKVNASDIAVHFPAKKKACRVMRRCQKAIRIASSVPNMLPKDALLLLQIYRSHPRSLASESPAKLLRDFERYSQSSIGRKQMRGKALPSKERIKDWIDHCAKSELTSHHHDLAG